ASAIALTKPRLAPVIRLTFPSKLKLSIVLQAVMYPSQLKIYIVAAVCRIEEGSSSHSRTMAHGFRDRSATTLETPAQFAGHRRVEGDDNGGSARPYRNLFHLELCATV